MVLRQCAHFYNTIGSQMIDSQKPLMLADALEFEKARRQISCCHIFLLDACRAATMQWHVLTQCILMMPCRY
jgi:hypothetical protein